MSSRSLKGRVENQFQFTVYRLIQVSNENRTSYKTVDCIIVVHVRIVNKYCKYCWLCGVLNNEYSRLSLLCSE